MAVWYSSLMPKYFTSLIINTAAPIRRGSAALFIGYDSDLQKALTVVRDAAQTAEGVLEEPVVLCVRELGQMILIEARLTDSRRSDFVATTSTVMQAIVAALKEAHWSTRP